MQLGERLEAGLRRRVARGMDNRLHRWRNSLAVAAISRTEREVPYASPERREALQRRRIRAVVEHAYRQVPFYRTFMREHHLAPDDFRSAEDLARFPFIDGPMLAEDPMRFVADPYRRTDREVFKTSGSTSGLRKPIFWDHASLLLRAARGERDRVVIARLAGESWYRVILREFITNERRHTLARWLGVNTDDHQRLLILPADFSSRTQRTIYSERTVIPRRPVHYHHLPPTVPFHVAAAHVAALRPRVVFSFGSYVDQFFHYLEASGTDIPLPRLWVYLGDRISPPGRELAEQRGCPLYSVYGAMEAGTIGFQCEQRAGFHLNTDLCSVRIVDDEGGDVPAGTPGDIVISPLDNRAMVLLNYRIGDRGSISTEPCSCGRTLPLLANMEGRCSELLKLADGRELSSLAVEALFSGYLRQTVKAQIEQPRPGELLWRIVPFKEANRDTLREAVVARGRDAVGADTRVSVAFVEDIPLTPAGKFLRAVVKPGGGGDA